MHSFAMKASGAVAISVSLLTAAPSAAGPVVFSVGGSDAISSIQPTVTSFQTALGNPNNGNNAGTTGGRREINWDGGNPAIVANGPGGTPFNVFLNNRGAQFTTPGTGFVQAPPSGGPDNGLAGAFNNLTYGDIFTVFSASRDFTPVGSNIDQRSLFHSRNQRWHGCRSQGLWRGVHRRRFGDQHENRLFRQKRKFFLPSSLSRRARSRIKASRSWAWSSTRAKRSSG